MAVTLQIQRGSSVQWEVEIADDQGQPVDLTDMVWEVLENKLSFAADAPPGLTADPTFEILDAPLGKSMIGWTETQTKNFKKGTKPLRIRIVEGDWNAIAFPEVEVEIL